MRKMWKDLLIILSLAGPLAMAQEESKAPKKPNIIFLFSDDQQANTVRAFGNPHIKTPNLDSLADAGFSFRQTYCGGSYSGAVCVASRSMLMTGRHWMQIEDTKKWSGLKTLPAELSSQGYHSHIVGKWHNGPQTLLRSFQSGSSVFLGGMCNHIEVPLVEIKHGKLTNRRVEKGFSSTMFADAAVDFLSKEQGDPFFLYVAFTAPHDSRNPPVAYREMYYKNLPPVPENFLPLHPFDTGLLHPTMRDESLAPWPRPKAMVQQQMAEYYGLITHLDEQIGRVLAAVENREDRENTYVIFTADHGLSLGQHGLMGKQNLYEHSMKSPLIIRGPKVPKGEMSHALTYIHDLHPTLLKLAGVNKAPAVNTADLAPLWQGKRDTIRDTVFMGFSGKIRSIRDERWKLLVYPEINHTQLFDLQNDPLERVNLAGRSETEDVTSKLMDSMQQWQKKLGDEQALHSDTPKAKEVDYSEFKQRRDRWQPDWIFKKYFR
ncbi:MAG: sulfatase-like hydrolase/transferase [Rubritalea sp.]|uniref:sulfatase-like hydrolase/transferase n=1 Tax=Rubritalea sp. TaxID=2109375 RepID=UPI003242D626